MKEHAAHVHRSLGGGSSRGIVVPRVRIVVVRVSVVGVTVSVVAGGAVACDLSDLDDVLPELSRVDQQRLVDIVAVLVRIFVV